MLQLILKSKVLRYWGSFLLSRLIPGFIHPFLFKKDVLLRSQEIWFGDHSVTVICVDFEHRDGNGTRWLPICTQFSPARSMMPVFRLKSTPRMQWTGILDIIWIFFFGRRLVPNSNIQVCFTARDGAEHLLSPSGAARRHLAVDAACWLSVQSRYVCCAS